MSIKYNLNICQILAKTNKQILNNNDLVKYYGDNIKYIMCAMLVNDIIIAFYDNINILQPTTDDVTLFINSLKFINNKEQKKCVGIYLSRLPLTTNAMKMFNNINKSNIFCCSNICDQSHDLMLQKLFIILYENNIYFYEDDESCYMLETNGNIIIY